MPRALDRRSLIGLKPLTPRSAQTVCRSLNLHADHLPPALVQEELKSTARKLRPPGGSPDAALGGAVDESQAPSSPRPATAMQGPSRLPPRLGLKRPLTSGQLLMAAHQQRVMVDGAVAPRFWTPVRSKRYDAKRYLQKSSRTEIKASAARRDHDLLALAMSGFRSAEKPATGPVNAKLSLDATSPLPWHTSENIPADLLPATPQVHSTLSGNSAGWDRQCDQAPDSAIRTWSPKRC